MPTFSAWVVLRRTSAADLPVLLRHACTLVIGVEVHEQEAHLFEPGRLQAPSKAQALEIKEVVVEQLTEAARASRQSLTSSSIRIVMVVDLPWRAGL